MFPIEAVVGGEVPATRHSKLDTWMLAAIVTAAIAGGIALMGVYPGFFRFPRLPILAGGTLGVMFMTLPGSVLLYSRQRVKAVSSPRTTRANELFAIDPLIEQELERTAAAAASLMEFPLNRPVQAAPVFQP
jgi:hypothetical protein